MPSSLILCLGGSRLAVNGASGPAIKRPAVAQFLFDIGWIFIAGVLALSLTGQNPIFWRMNLAGAALVAFCGALFHRFLEVYRIRKFPVARAEWRIFGIQLIGVLGIALVLGLAFRITSPGAFAVLISFVGTAAMLGERYVRTRGSDREEPVGDGAKRRVLILGAGGAAEMLLQDLTQQGAGLKIIGLLDDDSHKVGSTVFGYRVLGQICDLQRVVDEQQVNEVILAIPSLNREDQRRILGICEGVSAKLRMMPSISRQLAEAGQGLPTLRDVAPEELLRRDSIETDMSGAADYVAGEVVLITGGGGSIGSELARQLITLRPKQLILLGKGENSIFEAEMDLRQRGFTDVVPIIAGVRDRAALEKVMREFRPTVVFHAAAHKHVPLMERVPIEAVQNNVFGTLNAAEVAIEFGVKKFILISTDKAVNPTNVMGATKRAAEMVIMALAGGSATEFAAVRFGNVLGSRGSLIPILKNQIARGGPITITDERMTRFFMTIPEAAQLVIQAGSHGGAGEIFILDMGEPVKIVDVARGLIALYGLEEGRDIELKFIGARPGEKIHEELSWESEDLERIDSGKILRLKSPGRLSWAELSGRLDRLDELCSLGDSDVVRAELMDLVGGVEVTTGLATPVSEG
ncbi:MAG: polysaccharide biosynthesis protein [Fimbriimonadaceae bacterium]